MKKTIAKLELKSPSFIQQVITLPQHYFSPIKSTIQLNFVFFYEANHRMCLKSSPPQKVKAAMQELYFKGKL